jgi:hypothetical protein
MATPPQIPDKQAWQIAQVIHEAVRAWQKANHEKASPSWNRAPQWMKDSSREAVLWRLANPNAPASAQHDQWMSQKQAAGWVFGKKKSGSKKTHPMMIPYSDLPESERRKDALVGGVIDALTKAMS